MSRFKISYIVPFTHKMISVQILYNYQVIHSYFVMPWETGISKSISFAANIQDAEFDINKFQIINNANKMPIITESVVFNDNVQNISPSVPQNQKYVYLDVFFKACNIDATVFKVSDLPSEVKLSHSYTCNGNLYVAKCDRFNSTLNFHKDFTDFKFTIGCYHNKIVDCLYNIECHYDSNTISTKIITPHPHSIAELHNYLKDNYQESDRTTHNTSNHVEEVQKTG